MSWVVGVGATWVLAGWESRQVLPVCGTLCLPRGSAETKGLLGGTLLLAQPAQPQGSACHRCHHKPTRLREAENKPSEQPLLLLCLSVPSPRLHPHTAHGWEQDWWGN